MKKHFDLCLLKITMKKDEKGKKYFPNMPYINFNISHSGNWIVLVVGNQQVGIDIQKKEKVCIDSIIDYLGENNFYEGLSDEEKYEFFYGNWVIRESFLKAIGTGFLIPYTLQEININRINKIVSNNEWSYSFELKRIEENYLLSLCTKEPVSKINMIDITKKELLNIILK